MHENALIHEKSPYLRQHAANPVDWLPWGETAFEKARRENKPIFLSIGYSTCHWCHVMAHESFEDEGTAAILNREFVPIKVDREERPDVDRIYMLFVQATTGGGGWPMSVWLTPDLKPFFGGTYFPPSSRYGRPGFREVLQYLAKAWKEERERVVSSGASVAEQLRGMAETQAEGVDLDRELFNAAFWQFRRAYDPRRGGFGRAPKFPRPVVMNYLLRYYAAEKNPEALEMVVHTLRAMAAGGMHDQLGGGFHRYSVDDRWFVPHFEKMLYDQAQLLQAFVEAYQVTRAEDLAETAKDIIAYVGRDLTDPQGGFFSAEDADSPDPENPGHSREGAFYVWTKAEIEAVLGAEAAREFCEYYGVQEQGNVDEDPQGEFARHNILFRAKSNAGDEGNHAVLSSGSAESLVRSRSRLFAERTKRPRPHLDRKVLTSWNGLMISALSKAYVVFGTAAYLDMAERAARFLLSVMYDPESGRLNRRFCDGDSAIPGFLDDYAFLARALLDLFEAAGKVEYLKVALDLIDRGFPLFEDPENGGFFSTAAASQDLILRLKDDYDGAEPTGNSVATDVLLRAAHLTGDEEMRERAGRSLRAFAPKLKLQPTIAPEMLVALGRWLAEPEEVILRVAEPAAEASGILAEHRQRFAPYSLVAQVGDAGARELQDLSPFLSNLERKGRMTLYECRKFTCELPKVIE